jgi:hypothetical protein
MQCYLNAGPMIRALSDDPSSFEMRRNCVFHRPSRHLLTFDPDGNAHILARCDCAELPVTRNQSERLLAAVNDWQENYWRPLLAREAAERRVAEINREFASHFAPRRRWRRAVDRVLAAFGLARTQPQFRIDPGLPEDADLAPPCPASAQDADLSSPGPEASAPGEANRDELVSV